MYIFFEDEESIKVGIIENMVKGAEQALIAEGVDPKRAEISVSFVDGTRIRELNKAYRNVDKVTDVLSFPQYESVADMGNVGELCLGDVVICTDRAVEQAEEFGHSIDRELVYLFVHSIFHLLGYDHMEDDEKKVMREKEESIMEFLGIER